MSSGRARGWALQILLFVSLAANLFVAGYFAAHLWEHRPPPPGGPMGLIERLAQPLPPADKDILLSAWKADQPKLGTLSGALQAARRDVRAKLVAEPFDRAALAAAMSDARTKHDALDEEVQGIILDAVGKFSPEGRRQLWSRPPPHP